MSESTQIAPVWHDGAVTPEAIESVAGLVPAFTRDWQGCLQSTALIQEVSSLAERQSATDAVLEVATMTKAAEEHFRPYADAAHKLHKHITGVRKDIVDELSRERRRLEFMIASFDNEQAKKRKAEEDRLRREQEEKAAAERKAREDAAIAEAEKLQAEGKGDEAEQVIEAAARETEKPVMVPEVILPDPTPSAKESGVGTVKTYSAVVEDFLALIRAAAENPDAYARFLVPDQKTLNAMARAQKDLFRVPGVRLDVKTTFRAVGR
ncbi:MAG TPA: hypothetical protein PLK67_00375 [Bryobacteraceae bacterium]|nr:hypothetical protein [Bryobacteraceae bacterium]